MDGGGHQGPGWSTDTLALWETGHLIKMTEVCLCGQVPEGKYRHAYIPSKEMSLLPREGELVLMREIK